MALRSIPNRGALQNNIGGIKKIYFLPKEYVTEFPPLTDGVYDMTAATINTVAAWFVAEFVRDTARITEEDAQGPNGPYEKIKVAFKVARHYDFRVPDMGDMREREFIVIVTDNNRLAVVIGEIDLQGEKKGMRFFKDRTSGDAEARNEYSCYFYTEHTINAQAASYTTLFPIEPPHNPGGEIPLEDPIP